jgi:hypothetical protein
MAWVGIAGGDEIKAERGRACCVWLGHCNTMVPFYIFPSPLAWCRNSGWDCAGKSTKELMVGGQRCKSKREPRRKTVCKMIEWESAQGHSLHSAL